MTEHITQLYGEVLLFCEERNTRKEILKIILMEKTLFGLCGIPDSRVNDPTQMKYVL